MKCPNCGTHNGEESNFCDHCGASLGGWSKTYTLKCLNCGTYNLDTNRFCRWCGLLLYHESAKVDHQKA
ncbi:MAG: zinc-ribbon domain-containing protein [Chloroflexi bacterium]|nr:zinc-ribbon domain-containing protein [Chloroflexota bacterium]